MFLLCSVKASSAKAGCAIPSEKTKTRLPNDPKCLFIRLFLTSLCPNERLISIVSTLKRLIYRYEFVYMNNPDLIASSVEQHKQIIGALTERSVKTATVLLEQN